MIEEGYDGDWVIGGDFNAEIGSRRFRATRPQGLHSDQRRRRRQRRHHLSQRALQVSDRPHLPLPEYGEASTGRKDFYIVAADHSIPDYVSKISDHRPVLARLSLGAAPRSITRPAPLPKGLQSALDELDQTTSLAKKRHKPVTSTRSAAAAARSAVTKMQSSPARGRHGARAEQQRHAGIARRSKVWQSRSHRRRGGPHHLSLQHRLRCHDRRFRGDGALCGRRRRPAAKHRQRRRTMRSIVDEATAILTAGSGPEG